MHPWSAPRVWRSRRTFWTMSPFRPIVGTDTRTAGFLGETERGPLTPLPVTGTHEFTDQYGGAIDGSYVAEAVAGFFDNGGERCYIARVAGTDDVAQTQLFDADGNPALAVSAVGPGTWGTNVAVTIADSLSGRTDEFTLTVRYWTDPDDQASASAQDGVPATDPTVEETFVGLSTAADGPMPLETQVNDGSTLIELELAGGDHPGRPTNGTRFLDGPATDPPATLAAYEGDTPGRAQSGLAALETIDDVSIVCAPDTAHVSGLADALASHCSDLGDRFAVLDPALDAGPIESLQPPVASRYAAFYYPWIEVGRSTPEGSTEVVPASGHIAGVYARVDAERGVHRAPANERIQGATDVQVGIDGADQAILNPRGVNCIRRFSGRGIRVWGARTTANEPQWRYVNVCRLVVYLTESIVDGIRWVQFERNEDRIRARVQESIRDFLADRWRDGQLRGTTPEDAFFVRCDRSTTTREDLDRGRLVALVGVAPTRPAEFIVFEVSQRTADAD